MATIRYEIADGILPFSVILREGVSLIDINFHVSTGQYYFTEVPDGNYTITVVDAVGCETAFNVFVNCITTTTEPTTSTEEQSTTTLESTTTVEQTTTSEEITTTHEDLPALKTCLDDALIYEGTLGFTPVSTVPLGMDGNGANIVEDSTYIFTIFNDTTDDDYKYHIVWRYHKITEVVSTKTIMTTNGYCCDNHKVPALMITSSGSLLVAIEQLPGTGNHNGAMDIFRWADVSDLDTYSTATIGNSTTERLAYPFLYEIGSNIILESRRYDGDGHMRVYYTSSDDGASFGAMTEYITFSDSDYWIYKIQVRNNLPSKNDAILCIMPSNHDYGYNIFQYITYLKTDFTGNFYALDGTDLGTSVTGAELAAYSSWGDTTKNKNLYYLQGSKLFGNDIYAIGYIGTMPTSTPNVTHMQIIKTNINTGVVTMGSAFAHKFNSDVMVGVVLFNICDDIYAKMVVDNTIYYFQIDQDLNDMTLVYSETGTYAGQIPTDFYTELTADYDYNTKTFRVFRMSDPDIVWNMTTTTSTTGLVTSTTTTELPITTTSTTTELGENSIQCNLIACWEFQETSGTVAYDAHDGSHDGSITGATINQTGYGNLTKAYSFDGDGDYVQVPHHADFNIIGDISISAWIKIDDYANYNGIISKCTSNKPYPFDFWIEQTTGVLVFLMGRGSTGTNSFIGTTQIPTNTWTHITVTRSGTNVKFYIDGSFIEETNLFNPLLAGGTNDVYIGNRIDSDADMKGDMLQIAIWNKELTSTEVGQLYNNGNVLPYLQWDCPTTTAEPTTTVEATTTEEQLTTTVEPTTTEEVTTTSGG